ncbi:hypothetical protein D3C76_1706190 [compost metagenome]
MFGCVAFEQCGALGLEPGIVKPQDFFCLGTAVRVEQVEVPRHNDVLAFGVGQDVAAIAPDPVVAALAVPGQ